MKTGTDGAIPSGNAVATSVLLRLFSFTGEERYYERAGRILRVFQTVMAQNPYSASALLCTLDWWLTGPKEIVILGPGEHSVTQAMLTTVQQHYIPNRVVLTVEEAASSGISDLSLMKGKVCLDGRPTAYVCQHRTCSRPHRRTTARGCLRKHDGDRRRPAADDHLYRGSSRTVTGMRAMISDAPSGSAHCRTVTFHKAPLVDIDRWRRRKRS
jgi:uncharacterized protein YyaL (SSP411 family)